MLGIFPVGDLTEVVEVEARADAVILEEPEHCAHPETKALLPPVAWLRHAAKLSARLVCVLKLPTMPIFSCGFTSDTDGSAVQ